MRFPVKKQPPNFHLLVKPTGAVCNRSRFQMSERLVKIYIKQLIEAHQTREVTLSWQGGEPTIMGLDFFRKAVHYAEQCKKPGQKLLYTLQTNGTLLDNDWCKFFKAHNFLIGISIDGPQDLHNAYRVDKNGSGTFQKVIQGWELLTKHTVDVNILCSVHAVNEQRGLEVYRFFRDTLNATFIQFIPIVETPETQVSTLNYSVNMLQFGKFLIEIFAEWFGRDNGKIFVQAFDVALGNWIGQYTLCTHAPTCGRSLVLEHNGDMYSCDHFVDKEHLLGNIMTTPMIDLVASEQQLEFGTSKLAMLPQYCKQCDVFSLCYGGCPKDRIIKTPDGEPSLNYLCAGYKAFFQHIIPSLKEMARYL
ncbi:MAG: chuR [Firmicutes bacterium]|nr:chuR [Bacillota bacterium]